MDMFKKLAIAAVAAVCLSFAFVSCSGKGDGKAKNDDKVYVEPYFASEQYYSYDESEDVPVVKPKSGNVEMLGVIPIQGVVESFTSGLIYEGQPLMVRFFSGLNMKKKQGEALSASTFAITPELAGEAYWIDDRTIGYRMTEKTRQKQPYTVTVNLNEFVNVKGDSELKFGFAVSHQDFDIVDVRTESLENSANLNIVLAFVNPVEANTVLEMLDDDIRSKYMCTAEKRSYNRVQVSISNLPAERKPYDITVAFDGSSCGVDKTVKKQVRIEAEKSFKVTGHMIDDENWSVTVFYSRPLKARQNLDGLVIPSVPLEFSALVNDNKLVIYFNKSYRNRRAFENPFDIEISKNIRSVSGSGSHEDYKVEGINFNDRRPEIKWCEEGVIVPETKDATVHFSAKCLNAVIVRVIRVYSNNMLSFFQENDIENEWGIRRYGRLEKKVKVMLDNDNPNEWRNYPLKLSDFVDIKAGDMYQLTVDFDPTCYIYSSEVKGDYEPVMMQDETDYWNKKTYEYRKYYWSGSWDKDPTELYYYNDVEIKRNLLVSNLGMTVKYAEGDDVTVFVRNINDATPVSKAKVMVYNYQNQLVEQTQTDGNGIAVLNYHPSMFCIVAEDAKGNKAIKKFENYQSLETSKFDVSGVSLPNELNGYMYSNRGVWRPGDEFQLNFILNDMHKTLPADFPVIMEVYDANSRLYDRQTNNSPVGNIYSFRVKTNASDPTGKWKAVFKVGNSRFSNNLTVDAVKPNRLEINFRTDDTIRISKGTDISATLTARWLNGLKAENLSGEVFARINGTQTIFPTYAGYTFENETEDKVNARVDVFSGSISDSVVSLSRFKDVNAWGMASVSFDIKVYEPEGDFSKTVSYAILSPADRYIGVRLPQTRSKYGDYYFVNEDWNFDVVEVDEYGKPMTKTHQLEYVLYKLENYWWWSGNENYNLKNYVTGNYKAEYKSGKIKCTDGAGSFTLNVAEDDWGSYLLVVKGDKGEVWSKVLHFDWEYSSQHSFAKSDAPALVTLKTDKNSYNIGETMRVSFPASEGAKAFLTVEAPTKILKTMNLNNLAEDNYVDIPVTADMMPNAYVYISLLQSYDKTSDLPIRMYGIVPVKVTDEQTKLKPVLTVPEESKTDSEVAISVSETNGKPMYYTIAVVDEGILGITNYRTPNPYNHFFRKQALRIRTWDNYNDVIDVFTGSLSSVYVIGGDAENEMLMMDRAKIKSRGAIEEALRKRAKSVAETMGPFELKAGQTNTHKYNISNYLGSLRVMVVACNPDKNAYGSDSKNIRVKDPLMVLATAPRFVAPNDEIEVPVQIFAPDFKQQTVDVSLAATNMKILSGSVDKLKLDINGEATFRLKMRVDKTMDDASLTVNATLGDNKAKSETLLPMRPVYVEKRAKVFEKVEPGTTETLSLEVGGFEGTRVGNVVVNAAIPVDIYNRLNYLVTYPHGCLEQVTSAVFPQLYLGTFVDMDDDLKTKTDANIKAGIDKLKTYLRSDYSMTNWVGGNYTNPWSELYALHFLVEARDKGYDVPKSMIDGMLKYQSSLARKWRFSSDAPYVETIQAYRLFVLALANKAETGAMNRFKELDLKYNLSKVLIASAYAKTGKTSIAKKMLANAEYNKTMSDYHTSFGSKTRDKAFYIYSQMLCEGDSKDIYAHITDICEAINSERWLDTQTTAMSLFVLGKYSQMVGYEGESISVSAEINGVEKSMLSSGITGSFAFAPVEGKNTLKVDNDSKSPVYVMMTGSGIVFDEGQKEDGNMLNMTVDYIDKYGQNINPTNLDRGTNFTAKIAVRNTTDYWITDNALTYKLPAGWQIDGVESGKGNVCKHTDARDDLVYFYFDLGAHDSIVVNVNMNATYKGVFNMPSVYCEDMYNDEIFYVIPSGKVEVR